MATSTQNLNTHTKKEAGFCSLMVMKMFCPLLLNIIWTKRQQGLSQQSTFNPNSRCLLHMFRLLDRNTCLQIYISW